MDTPATAPTYNLDCPISIKWNISEDKLATLKDSTTNQYLETKQFDAPNIPGVKYDLTIFPNGREEETRGEVWILLFLQYGNEKKIKSDVKFSIESAGFSHNSSHEYDYSKGKGIKICSTSEFFDPENKFIVDGEFTVKCEGMLSVERERLSGDVNGFNSYDEHIGQKLWKKNNKDFIIKVGESSIEAHKYILAAQSPVFEAMFESGMKETKENQMDIVDFSFNVVQAAIQLCYNVLTSVALKLEEKMALLQFFDKYDMSSLKAVCQASLIGDVSASNVCQFAKCSILSNAIKLERKCAEFLTQCIKAGIPLTDFDILDKDFICKAISNVCCNIHKT